MTAPPISGPDAPPEAPPTPPEAPPAPPAQPAQEDAGWLGWLFLIGLAAIIALLDPVVIALQPRLAVSVVLLIGGTALLALGRLRHWELVTWGGAAVLWTEIAAGVATQIAPLGLAPGLLWAPRLALLTVALLGWALFLNPPVWLRRGAVAAALPTFALCGALWLGSSPLYRSAGFYWLAVDSHDTLYATDTDNGAIWVFDSNGGIRGKIWPGQQVPAGQTGPGIRPAGMSSSLFVPLTGVIVSPNALLYRQYAFCGLAVDPQDHLYSVDYSTAPLLPHLLQFDRDGNLLHSWVLPDTYRPARGCLAADANHIYVGDNFGIVDVYDHAGHLLTHWTQDLVSMGLAPTPQGHAVVLHQTAVDVLQYPQGQAAHEWKLPAPQGYLEVPYQAIATRPNGEVLVTDVTSNQVLRYSPTGEKLAPLGAPGGWPGQFSGLAGLATDTQGRVYVADLDHRVIQRFDAAGHAEAVWSAPEDENGEE